MAKITLIGMYNFDESLFENLTVPDGIDRQTLIDNILIESGDFEVLYPDMDFLKFSIGAWSRKYRPTFERWSKVLNMEYDPIENYNRYESWTDDTSGSGSGSNSMNRSGSASGNTSGNTSSTNTNFVSAYDAGDALTTKDQTLTAGNDSSNSTSTTSENTSGTESSQFTNSGKHEGRIHGNIGVMSTQTMVEQEIKLGYKNIYDLITELFVAEFVLPIY